MKQYIDKAAAVAEIKKLKKKFMNQDDEFSDGFHYALKLATFLLDTLEVKEVDIGDAVHGTVDFPLIGYDFPNIYPNYKELKEYCDKKGIKDNDKVKFILIKDI